MTLLLLGHCQKTLLKVKDPPLLEVVESPLIPPLPPLRDDERPAVIDAAPPSEAEEDPLLKVIDPPLPVSAEPTLMTTLPPVPEVASPVSIVKMPLLPFVVVPVDKVIAPLTPPVPESAVLIVTAPDATVDGPVPDVILMLPPVPELPFPRTSYTAPPAALPAPLRKVTAAPLP